MVMPRYLRTQDNQIQNLSQDVVYQRCQKELAFLENLAFNAMESNTIILLKKSLNEAESLYENNHTFSISVF